MVTMLFKFSGINLNGYLEKIIRDYDPQNNFRAVMSYIQGDSSKYSEVDIVLSLTSRSVLPVGFPAMSGVNSSRTCRLSVI